MKIFDCGQINHCSIRAKDRPVETPGASAAKKTP